MLNKILDFTIQISGKYNVSIGQLLGMIILLGISYLGWKVVQSKWKSAFFEKNDVSLLQRRRFDRIIKQLITLLTFYFGIKILKLDFVLYHIGDVGESHGVSIRYSIIVLAFILMVLVWLIDWFMSNILAHKYERQRSTAGWISGESTEVFRVKMTQWVQYIVIILTSIAVIRRFDLDFSYAFGSTENQVIISLSGILSFVLLFLMARVFVWVLTKIVLYGVYRQNDIDAGSQFAINQLLKYVIYTFTTILALHNLGINMTLIWGGAAALLVGVGLGLQQTFNDFFSGILLLFERSISVGDVVHFNGEVGRVKKIGMRASIIETRKKFQIIVPNSKLVVDSVFNWTPGQDFVRFDVSVHVAYGSDTTMVKDLLIQSAEEHDLVIKYPKPFVRFINFGDFSLEFNLYFFANRYIIIEDIKSDLRFRINELFNENDIKIPFPQREVWVNHNDK